MSCDAPSFIPYSVFGTGPWYEMVGEATKSRVEVIPYYGAVLNKAADGWTAAQTGITDIQWCMTGLFPGQFPLTEVGNLPLLGIPKGETLSRALWRLYEEYPEIQAEYAPVKLLALWVLYSGV